MTAVTTASAAWVECAGIAAVVIPLYLAFIFREFVLCRIPLFAWLQARLPSDRTGTSNGAHSPSPRVSATTSKQRGTSVDRADAALTDALNGIGDEFDDVSFYWPEAVCR